MPAAGEIGPDQQEEVEQKVKEAKSMLAELLAFARDVAEGSVTAGATHFEDERMILNGEAPGTSNRP